MRRASITRGESVRRLIPSFTVVLQAVKRRSSHSSSTRHIRQEPISLIPSR